MDPTPRYRELVDLYNCRLPGQDPFLRALASLMSKHPDALTNPIHEGSKLRLIPDTFGDPGDREPHEWLMFRVEDARDKMSHLGLIHWGGTDPAGFEFTPAGGSLDADQLGRIFGLVNSLNNHHAELKTPKIVEFFRQIHKDNEAWPASSS